MRARAVQSPTELTVMSDESRVEMQMAVRGKPEVSDLRPDGRQRLAQPGSAGPVVGVDLGVGAHARIEQEHSPGMADEITEARFHSRTARPGLPRRPHEVAEINAPHRNISHVAILTAHPAAHGQR